MTRRLLPYGELGLLLECSDLVETLGVLRALQRSGFEELTEVVPGARTIYVGTRASPSREAQQLLLDIDPLPGDREDTKHVEIEVHYDGEDLAEVAELVGLSAAEVVAAHTGQLWTVGFCGFAPGFGYLHGEHEKLKVPRRRTPRTAVPAGAVGLADAWSGIYPRTGPGGWQLIGHTTQTLWDLDADPPAMLQPGTTVRFVAADLQASPA